LQRAGRIDRVRARAREQPIKSFTLDWRESSQAPSVLPRAPLHFLPKKGRISTSLVQ
jgi:hypothetical protein